MGHLTSSVMTRGSTTQARTFVYNDLGQLTSATNPESGTTTYTYYPNNLLATKQDANGGIVSYGWDSQNRFVGQVRILLKSITVLL